jgi:hypothetical protein
MKDSAKLMVERFFFVALCVGGMEKCGKTYELLKGKTAARIVSLSRFTFLLQTYSENMGQKISFSF